VAVFPTCNFKLDKPAKRSPPPATPVAPPSTLVPSGISTQTPLVSPPCPPTYSLSEGLGWVVSGWIGIASCRCDLVALVMGMFDDSNVSHSFVHGFVSTRSQFKVLSMLIAAMSRSQFMLDSMFSEGERYIMSDSGNISFLFLNGFPSTRSH